MNILLLNTYKHGGAGIACSRLQTALQQEGITANMLTAADTGVRWPFYAERLSFLPYEHDKSVRFSFSPAAFGVDLRNHPLVQQADVLHLHWINQGFLSLKGIHDLAKLGKPIVWTLHDMWGFTGGCHYSRGCLLYQDACGHCPYLRNPGDKDLSYRVLKKKRDLFPAGIQYVTCSEWLRDVALTSGLLKDRSVIAIPNPIDTSVFKPSGAEEQMKYRAELGIAPGAHVLLFVAMKVSETRKGFQYLQQSLERLRATRPDFLLEVVVMGKAEASVMAALPYPVHLTGMLEDASVIARVYGSADVFVIPSLEDNLPNTVMEALACGTPVVGFETGGIPEMVKHRVQGYIAGQGDIGGLTEGIVWVLGQAGLREAARKKVEKTYADKVVAERYMEAYKALI